MRYVLIGLAVLVTAAAAVFWLWPRSSAGTETALGRSESYAVELTTSPRKGEIAASVMVTGLAYAAMQALSWVIAPAITRAYAAAIDLPLRDFVDGTAFYPSFTPFVVLPVALLVAGAMAVSKRISSPQIAVPIIGAVAAALMALGFLAQLDAPDTGTVVGAAVLGLVIGWLGWRLAAPLRTQMEV